MNVLIIEDSEIKFANIRKVLDEAEINYSKIPIKTYIECMKELRENHHNYDMIILDMALPRFSKESPYMIAGYDILRRMHYEKIFLPTIVLTGFSSFTVDGEIMDYIQLENKIYDSCDVSKDTKILHYNNRKKDWEYSLVNFATQVKEKI